MLVFGCVVILKVRAHAPQLLHLYGESLSLLQNKPLDCKVQRCSTMIRCCRGSFGAVYKVTHRKTREDRAAKLKRVIKTRELDAATLEVEVLARLRHHYVVSFIDAYQCDGNVAVVTEL